jgi:hypothetical protein
MISSEPAAAAPTHAMARILIAIALTSLSLTTARTAEPAAMDARIQAMLPELERVVDDGTLDPHGKLGLLRLSFDDGQAYEFRRE